MFNSGLISCKNRVRVLIKAVIKTYKLPYKTFGTGFGKR